MRSWTTLFEKTVIRSVSFDSLPEEIVIEILSRLPVKSLSRCKCLCKSLLKLISNHYFVQSHLEASKYTPRIIFTTVSDQSKERTSLSSLEYDQTTSDHVPNNYLVSLQGELSIAGSCNGLLCLSEYQTSMVLCNPATKEYIEVPFDIVEVPAGYMRVTNLGVGHVHTDQYKVVRIDNYVTDPSYHNNDIDDDLGYYYVHVYTLGTKCWRRIKKQCHSAVPFNLPYLNGALHWGNADRQDPHLQGV
ncbi:hypothetical protein IFM89_036001 [Coptis chinensis]|uniref:F-box domain-containing protein n=1 Tax=Coptis chinensis TaxID=261450 RepID=A0A835M8B1_9MAGN|nr:hypothetical protein IFM89_036001 [Coptis chinensis]